MMLLIEWLMMPFMVVNDGYMWLYNDAVNGDSLVMLLMMLLIAANDG